MSTTAPEIGPDSSAAPTPATTRHEPETGAAEAPTPAPEAPEVPTAFQQPPAPSVSQPPLATAEAFLSKKRRSHETTVTLNGQQMRVQFLALGGKAFDQLIEAHPSKKRDERWDAATFEPALVAATLTAPHLSEEQAQAIWANDDWSTGEKESLFNLCWLVNTSGLDVPFTAAV